MSPFAIVLVLCAACAHATWNILAASLSKSGFVFLWWGALASTLLWIGVVPFAGGLGSADVASLVLGVGVSTLFHVAYLRMLQQGYRVGRLSTVYATARGSGPFLAVIFAISVLGERPHPLALLGVAIDTKRCHVKTPNKTRLKSLLNR